MLEKVHSAMLLEGVSLNSKLLKCWEKKAEEPPALNTYMRAKVSAASY